MPHQYRYGNNTQLGFNPDRKASVVRIEIADGAIADPTRSYGAPGVDVEDAYLSFHTTPAGGVRRRRAAAPENEYKEPTGDKRLLIVEYVRLAATFDFAKEGW